MLPKKNRADRKAVKRIFSKGKSINLPSLSFKFILTDKPIAPQISFIAPKTVAKLAVNRNLLRRRGYAVLGKYINEFPIGLIGIFIFKRRQENILILENEIKNIFNKMH